jgi:nucleoside-diphosphate-sugar epimerase
MRVFLTGATGFIGTKLLAHLLQRPDVSAVQCLTRRREGLSDPRVTWIQGDLTSDSWISEVKPIDTVIHAGAEASFHHTRDQELTNVHGTHNVIECARRASARRLVFVSSIGAVDRPANDPITGPLHELSLPSPRSAYGRSKLDAEAAVRHSGLNWTIVRPAWVYGQGMRLNSHLCVLAAMARRRHPLSYFYWPGKVSVVHVDDLCTVLARIACDASLSPETFYAATENISIGHALRIFGRQTGAPYAARLPTCHWFTRSLIARLHSIVPLPFANLFVDYLTCDPTRFRQLLEPTLPRTFEECYGDVLETIDPLRKTWLITGAGSGIGRAMGELLASQGVRIIAVDKHFPEAPVANVTHVQCDLRDADAVSRLQHIVERKDVSVVVNNAGVGTRSCFATHNTADLLAALNVNIFVPVLFAHSAMAVLSQRRGTLINIGSSVAGIPLPGMAVYSASKGFLQTWSLGLASELSDEIHVLTVAPTGTRTGFQKAAGVKGGQRTLLAPERVAAAIVDAAVKRKTFVCIGPWPIRVVMYAGRLLPLAIQPIIWGKAFGILR